MENSEDLFFTRTVTDLVQTSTSTLTLICSVITQDDFSRGQAGYLFTLLRFVWPAGFRFKIHGLTI